MQLAIPLERMSTMEKLRAIEDIWADLACEKGDLPSPAWHADILREREERIANGTSRFLDIGEAKQAVHEHLK